ncbi:MAG: hypothetical protein HZA17_10935, partial [Nitrospirae bacterium]|nr:hypothetical protein [Nitrospirota bacterium]
AGNYHTMAIKKNGTLWAWGGNGHGQLGDGTTTGKHSPQQIGTDTNWVSVTATGIDTLAIKSDGTLWAWGWNQMAELGDGTRSERHSPQQIGTDTNWASVSLGTVYHTLAIKSDGTLWAWGQQYSGKIANGTQTEYHYFSRPTQIGIENNWFAVAAGGAHSVALKSDGTLWTWGYNGSGQLGDGTTLGDGQVIVGGIVTLYRSKPELIMSVGGPEIQPSNNCAAILSNDFSLLHLPILTYAGYAFWADFTYVPNTLNFNLVNYGLVSDASPFVNCSPSILGSDLSASIPAVTFVGGSYWLNLIYSGQGVTFTVTGAGAN